jgi:hypothetical protein
MPFSSDTPDRCIWRYPGYSRRNRQTTLAQVSQGCSELSATAVNASGFLHWTSYAVEIINLEFTDMVSLFSLTWTDLAAFWPCHGPACILVAPRQAFPVSSL